MSNRLTQAQWQEQFVLVIEQYPTLLSKIKIEQKELAKSSTWWVNPINPNSLRLSRTAYRLLRLLKDWKLHKIRLENPIKPKTYLQLETLFNEPYYIENYKTIYLHGEKDVVMVTLHDNDLQRYLDNQTD